MSIFKREAVLNLEIVKLQLFWLLLISSTCSFDLIQAQAANVLISNIQSGQLENFGEALSAVESAGNINVPDPYGKTPLMYAVQSPIGGSNSSGKPIALTMVQDLLTAKADVTIVNPINGKTTLMYAAESLNDGIDPSTGVPIILEILQTLLTQKNKSRSVFLISPTLLNAKDHTGKAALDYAMSSKNFQASKISMTLLLTPGIEPILNLTTIQRKTFELFSALTQISGTKVGINPNFFSNAIIKPSLPPTMTCDIAINGNWVPAIKDASGNPILSTSGNCQYAIDGVIKSLDEINASQATCVDGFWNGSSFGAVGTPATNCNYFYGVNLADACIGFVLTKEFETGICPTIDPNGNSIYRNASLTLYNQKGKSCLDGATGSGEYANFFKAQGVYPNCIYNYAYNSNPSVNYNQLAEIIAAIDVNAQDFTGNTALMYLAPLAIVTPSPAASNSIATNQLNSDLQTSAVTLATVQSDISAGATLSGEILNSALQLPSTNKDRAAIIQLIASSMLVNAILTAPNLNLNLTNISGKTASDLASGLSALVNAQTTQINNIATLFSNINSGNFTDITAYNVNTQDPTQGNNGATPLMNAAGGANPQANIQALSKFNVDYNAQDYNGQTALTYAALGQSPTVAIQTLLAIKDSNNNPLVDVNVQDDSGMTALMNALNLNWYAPAGTIPQTQMQATVGALLAAPNLNFALKDYSQPTPQTILDYANLLATNGMDAKSAATIVKAITTNINATYLTNLLAAINNSDLKTASQIITDVIQSGVSIDLPDANGATPLMHAAGSLSSTLDPNKIPSVPIIAEIITDLLNNSANVDAVDNQKATPLMYAAGSLNNAIDGATKIPIVITIIKTLLENYASISMQDSNKLTAYNYANKSSNSNQAAILTALRDAANIQLFEDVQNSTVTLALIQADLLAGADINATDLDKNTALYYAQQLPASNKDKAQIIAALTPSDTVSLGSIKQDNLKQVATPVAPQSPASTSGVKVPATVVTQAPVPAPVLATKPVPQKPKTKTKVKTIKRAKQITTAKSPVQKV